jgi:hypothetical protein
MLKEITTGIDMAGKLADTLRAAKSDSLIEYTQPARVEPIVLMDHKAVGLPYTGEIMQSLTSLFSGYYLQAIALSVNVGRVDVIKLLDKLNPKRSPMDNLANSQYITDGVSKIVGSLESAQSYTYKLPVPGETISVEGFSFEAAESDDSSGHLTNQSQRSQQLLQELTNLSVGKLLEVEVEDGGKRAVFPISVRMIATGIGPKELVHTLSQGSKNTSMKERYHLWRAGQLEFIRDLVLCQDLIESHKNTLLKDTSGIYEEIRRRRRGNKLSAIFSAQPSVATASNIVVMTKETAKNLEREIGGRLKDFRTREKIFKETYTMIMVVVDPDWDHVTFYHRSIELPTELSVKELQATNKSKGPDVAEILKAYQMGNSPSF